MIPQASQPLLEMRDICKSFPGVRAIRGVDLVLRAGEVLAVLGENGAGKSTLIRILGGVHAPDSGMILLDGEPAVFRSPAASRRAGVSVIHQEFSLIPGLSVRENLFLGRETGRWGVLRPAEEAAQARRLLGRLGCGIDPESICRDLSVASQQLVEIVKALCGEARVLVLDEPTAALTSSEADRLHAVLRELRQRGLGLIYISHRLEEILALADRVLVLRDGESVADRAMGGLSRRDLIGWMVGRDLEQEFPGRSVVPGGVRLVVRGLRRGTKVRDVDLSVRRGEVVGLTGLVGSGRTELARCLFGADRAEGGAIELDGRSLAIREPRDAIDAGLALLTEDRKGQGLVLGHSSRENFGLPNLGAFSRWGVVREDGERAALERYRRDLRIRLADPEQPVRNLSGGNQQKLVLAKWLERNCDVILFDEPTRGIDVGAKFEVYQLINELASQGKAILLISSDLPEVLGMCDRALVMREGRIAGEVPVVSGTRPEDILQLAVG